MARPKPWLKMWVEWIDDPKMLNLSLAEQGAWWRLLALAQRCMADGYLVKGNSAPLTLDEIATAIRVTTKPDRQVFDSMIKKMTDQGSLHWTSNALDVTHFAERQAKTTSETPEAIRDRVRRHRESQQVTENPLHPLTTPEALAKEIRATLMALPETIDYLVEHEVIKDTLAKLAQGRGLVPKSEVTTDTGRIDLLWEEPTGEIIAGFEIDVYEPKKRSLAKLKSLDCPYTFVILRSNPQPLQWEGDILLIGLSKERESSKEKEIKEGEGEAEGECNGTKHVTRNENTVTFVPALAKIAKLHEEYFGIISPNLSEKFKDFVENYHGPVEWIELAFAEAVKYKNRRWQYVEAILYSWQEKGGPHADRREPGGERERLGADQRDPLASYRAQGWEVLGEDEPEAAETGNQDR